MKKLFIITLTILFFASCSSFNVKTEIEKSSSIKKLKNSGLMIRLSKHSTIKRKSNKENLVNWLNGYVKNNKLIFIPKVKNSLNEYNNLLDRFYQLSINSKFLKYKSIGVINSYINNNKDELKSLFTDNNIDSLIIIEADGEFSTEIQRMAFDTMIVILNPELKIIYMDHQNDKFEIESVFNKEIIEKAFLDKINLRVTQKFEEIEFIKVK